MRRVDGYPLWLGNAGDVRQPSELLAAGIAAVVDLAVYEAQAVLPRELVLCRFPLVDGAGNPAWLVRMAAETVAALMRAGVSTLVACSAGMSRTPAIAAAGLALATGRSPVEALAIVTRTGPADVSPALWAEVVSMISAETNADDDSAN